MSPAHRDHSGSKRVLPRRGVCSASLPWAGYSIDLIDATDGMPIWTATATSGGNAFSDSDNLRKSLVGKTLEQLREDGILIKRP